MRFFHFIHGNIHEIQIFFHLIIEHLRSSKNPTPKLLRTNAQPIQFVVTICWWRELWLRLPFLPPPSLIYILWEGHAQPRGDANCNFVCRFYLLPSLIYILWEGHAHPPRAWSLWVAGKASDIPASATSLERVPGIQTAKHISQWRVSGQRGGPLTDGCQTKMKSTKRPPICKCVFFISSMETLMKFKYSFISSLSTSEVQKPNPKTASNERPTHTICGDYLLVTRTVTSFAVSTSSFTHLHPLRGTRSAPAGSVPLSASTTPKAIDPNDLQLVFFSTRAAPAGKAIEIRTVLWPSPEEGYLTEIDR